MYTEEVQANIFNSNTFYVSSIGCLSNKSPKNKILESDVKEVHLYSNFGSGTDIFIENCYTYVFIVNLKDNHSQVEMIYIFLLGFD